MDDQIDVFANQVNAIRQTAGDLRALVDEAIEVHDLELCERVLEQLVDAYEGLADGLISAAAERMAAAARLADDMERR
jgi:hypothetical protein